MMNKLKNHLWTIVIRNKYRNKRRFDAKYYKTIENFIDDNPTTRVQACMNNGYKLINIAYNPTNRFDRIDDYLRFIKIDKIDLIFNRVYGSKIISMIDYSITDHLLIDQIITNSEWTGRGLASKMIRIAEDNAIKNNITHIKLYIHKNKSKEKFYNKRGYTYAYQDDNSEHITWSVNPNYIEMNKSLTNILKKNKL